MRKYIPLPIQEPPERDAPLSGFDTKRALSQPELPVQDTAFRLFGNSQTFTERQAEHVELIKEYGSKEAFGDLIFQRQNTEGGMSWEAGTVTRTPRKK